MADDHTEIYSESVRVQSKVYYVDLKENNRGRYLKLSEKGSNRPRSTIIVPASGLAWFVKLILYYSGGGQLEDKELTVDNKVFYFSLGDNARGRFLRIGEACVGLLYKQGSARISLMIPIAGGADPGWATFRDCIQRVCNIGALACSSPQPEVTVSGRTVVVGAGTSPPSLSTSAAGTPVLSVWGKKFFFDLAENDKGSFLRVTEVVRSDRSTLIIPMVALATFQEALEASAALAMQRSSAAADPGAGAADPDDSSASCTQ